MPTPPGLKAIAEYAIIRAVAVPNTRPDRLIFVAISFKLYDLRED
jgi:hypothetical protein